MKKIRKPELSRDGKKIISYSFTGKYESIILAKIEGNDLTKKEDGYTTSKYNGNLPYTASWAIVINDITFFCDKPEKI